MYIINSLRLCSNGGIEGYDKVATPSWTAKRRRARRSRHSSRPQPGTGIPSAGPASPAGEATVMGQSAATSRVGEPPTTPAGNQVRSINSNAIADDAAR